MITVIILHGASGDKVGLVKADTIQDAKTGVIAVLNTIQGVKNDTND
jgi:predicted metallo-beta-lactamase superfamily hydrolase